MESRTIPNPDESWGEMTSEAIQALLLNNAIQSFPYRHPFFRRLYLVFFLLTSLVILLPFWTLLYIPVENRPRRTWTLERCLRVRWSRRLCGLVARCEIDYLGRDLTIELDPNSLKFSHPVTIPAAPPSILRGHIKETLNDICSSRGKWIPHFVHRVKRGKQGVWGRWNVENEEIQQYGFEDVKAFWFTGEKSSPQEDVKLRKPGDPVMLLFHGGGYLCGTAAETDMTSSIAKSMVKHSPIQHILSVDYRLAPAAPWPLPLLDAISSYCWLVRTEGVDERDIVIAGDSAGGHLALALVRWLRDEGQNVQLKLPRGLVLLSPWSDVGFTNAWGQEAMSHNRDSDTIDDTFGPFATSLLLRALPASIMHTSPYLSPSSLLLPSDASGPDSFKGFPPTYIVYGGAERLSRSIVLLWDRIQLSRQGDAHVVSDRLFVSPDAVHDFLIFAWMAVEASTVYEDLDEWLRLLLSTEQPTGEDSHVSPELWQKHDVSDWREMVQRGRISRQETRESLKSHKSPVMGPTTDHMGMMRMVEDMSGEGMSMIDKSAHFAIELPKSPEWLSPLTAEFGLDYAPDDSEVPWYDLDSADSDTETRKDR
ncbi:uncharacterized protein IL334_007086 [Kwoniella shivajii]|uniref:Alpha/beta hydrolase fold-3 domain-containing protein n=1 Tax=Kwoniella shivajii TaxID=564305 RepID=A0ABZ1DBP6_9TREE|nr:hypothetical protein IL334_007086 [Kwoniella shivajii]